MKQAVADLLKLLDDEQALADYLDSQGYNEYTFRNKEQGRGLTTDAAVLAFRLRDEAVKKDSTRWYEAVRRVALQSQVSTIDLFPDWLAQAREASVWLSCRGEPKHYIVTALFAKELAKEQL